METLVVTSALDVSIIEEDAVTYEAAADLDLQIGEKFQVQADLEAAVAGVQEATAGLNVSVREAGVSDGAAAVGLELQIEEPWSYANRILDQYGNRFIRLVDPGDDLICVALGDPHVRLLRRVNGVVIPSLDVGLANVVLALNVYLANERRIRVLVCNDVLSKRLLDFANEIGTIKGQMIRITAKDSESFGVLEYDIVKMETLITTQASLDIQAMPLNDLTSIADEVLVGSMF